MSTKYDNAKWNRCARTGGVTAVVLSAAGVGQGNDGTSLYCRGCWVHNRVGNSDIKMSIGTPATAVYGVEIAKSNNGAQPLWVPISDVAQLYFYGTRANVIDIVFLLG